MEVHLNSCKIRRRLLQQQQAGGLGQLPVTEAGSLGSTNQPAGSAREIRGSSTGSDTNGSGDDFVSELKKRYEENKVKLEEKERACEKKKKELEEKERECEEMRVLLSQWQAVIESCDSSATD